MYLVSDVGPDDATFAYGASQSGTVELSGGSRGLFWVTAARQSLLARGATEAARSRAAWPRRLGGGGALLTRDGEELFSRAAEAACSRRPRGELGEELSSRRDGGDLLAARVQRDGGRASLVRWTTSPAAALTAQPVRPCQ